MEDKSEEFEKKIKDLENKISMMGTGGGSGSGMDFDQMNAMIDRLKEDLKKDFATKEDLEKVKEKCKKAKKTAKKALKKSKKNKDRSTKN